MQTHQLHLPAGQILTASSCALAGRRVAQRAAGRPVEDPCPIGRRRSGNQGHVGQTQEVCGRRSGETLPHYSAIGPSKPTWALKALRK